MKSAEARYAFHFRNITSTLLVFAVTYALNAHFLLEISPVFLAVAALAADVLFAVLGRFKKNAVLWITLGTALAVTAVALEIAGVSIRALLREIWNWAQSAFAWFALYTGGGAETTLEPAYTLFSPAWDFWAARSSATRCPSTGFPAGALRRRAGCHDRFAHPRHRTGEVSSCLCGGLRGVVGDRAGQYAV